MRYHIVIIAVINVVLSCAQPVTAAEGDVRSVADKFANILATQHKQAESVLLESASNPIFDTYFSATDPVKKHAARDAINQVMLTVSQKYHVGEMCLIGAGGPELARVNDGIIATDLDQNETDNEFFATAMAQKPKTVTIVPPYVSHDTKNWVIAYATPIAQGGHTRAILHYEYSLADYQDLLRREASGTTHAMLVSADGYVMADNRLSIPVTLLGGAEKSEAYFNKFTLQNNDLVAIKNKLRGGTGRIGAGNRAVGVAWRDAAAGMTLVVTLDH
jgi:hypothetical protein